MYFIIFSLLNIIISIGIAALLYWLRSQAQDIGMRTLEYSCGSMNQRRKSRVNLLREVTLRIDGDFFTRTVSKEEYDYLIQNQDYCLANRMRPVVNVTLRRYVSERMSPIFKEYEFRLGYVDWEEDNNRRLVPEFIISFVSIELIIILLSIIF